MEPGAPIERRRAVLGHSYLQGGREIDRADMIAKLEKVPRSADALDGYEPSNSLSLIGAGAGGALIGWPLGAAAVGNPDPPWVLAAIGAGFVVVAVPLALSAEATLGGAVDEYNASLKGPGTLGGPWRARRESGVGPRRDRLELMPAPTRPTPEENEALAARQREREARAARQRAADEDAQRQALARWQTEHAAWQRDVTTVDDARAPLTTWVYVTAGAGAVLLGTGVYFLVAADQQHDHARAAAALWARTASEPDRVELERRVVELESRRDTFGVLGGTLAAAGGASLVTSLVLLIARPGYPDEPVRPVAARGGSGLRITGVF